MNNNLLIRPIKITDVDILWQMLYYATQMDKDDNKTIDDAKSDTFLKQFVEDWGKPDDIGFIAEQNQQAIGAVWIRLFDGEPYPELAIAVLPDFVGQGIGTQLMQEIINTCRGRYQKIILSVRTNNPAYRLYQRFGFQTLETITNRVGTQSYEMFLDL